MQLMRYQIIETIQAREDIKSIITYILETYGSKVGALNFLREYDKSVQSIERFPFAFRISGRKYRNIDIQIKHLRKYSIVYLVDEEKSHIVILRVLSMKMDRDNAMSKLNVF